MKALVISFVVGLLADVVYGVIRVKSPAPPVVGLLGLLGMVLSEQAGGWFVTKRIQTTNVASGHVVEAKDQCSFPTDNPVIRPCNRGGFGHNQIRCDTRTRNGVRRGHP